jgi:hypothetical protein
VRRVADILVVLVAALLTCASPVLGQDVSAAGTVSGTIVDDTGAGISGARITLSHDAQPSPAETFAAADGQFTFMNVPLGPFRLSVSAPGFASQSAAGMVVAGEPLKLPSIRLTLAAGTVNVDVMPLTRVEIAELQIKEQEQQRVFGVVPNFFVSYVADAVPLTTNQKFELSWKAHLDPVQFAFVAAVAGIQQKRNDFAGFGDGAEGYAKRYAAAYANVWTSSIMTQVLLPSLFKQDPRYFFYSGDGGWGARLGYAASRAFIRRGDNGRWQPSYSGVLGSLAAGGISNLYYPAEDRGGIALTLANTGLGITQSVVAHVVQEFLFKKLTSRGAQSRQTAP